MKKKTETNQGIKPHFFILLAAALLLTLMNQRLLSGKAVFGDSGKLSGQAIGYSEVQDRAELPQALVLNEKLNAVAAEVVDLQTKRNLLNYNGGQNWPAASLTKLMAAVVIEEFLDPGETINIPWTGPEDGVILPGEAYSVGDLEKIMLMSSSNKAAYSFEKHSPEGRFVEMMNEKAKDIGLTDTNFTDASGLSESSRTSGDDLVKLVQYIWENHRRVFTINRDPKGTITEIKSGQMKEISATHQFAGRPDFLGGKTGFTASAQGNLISIFSVENHPILILVLGTESRFEESEKILNFVTDASRSN
ncbi:MAG TPA: serine hydrolase [Candidatus Colwellbacteria bacterium]|nr:serine hydrolase [Candidatus Colwellbacteria bacterium]